MAPKRRRHEKAQSKRDTTSQKRAKLQVGTSRGPGTSTLRLVSNKVLIPFQHTNDNAATTEALSARSQSSLPNTTQPEQPASAAAQVFATPELLEQVLLAVNDVKWFMLMRRVASQWRAVIDDTTSLRKKMWLAPQQLDHEWYLSPGAEFLRKRPIATGRLAAADSGDIIYKSGITNPFLFDKSSPYRSRPIWTSHYHNSWVSPPLFVREQASSSFRKTGSLFLKMFATQPPVPAMYLRVRGDESALRNYRCLVEQVKNPKGVKVGDVLRAVAHLSESQKRAFVVDEMLFDLERFSEISIEPWAFRRYGHEF